MKRAVDNNNNGTRNIFFQHQTIEWKVLNPFLSSPESGLLYYWSGQISECKNMGLAGYWGDTKVLRAGQERVNQGTQSLVCPTLYITQWPRNITKTTITLFWLFFVIRSTFWAENEKMRILTWAITMKDNHLSVSKYLWEQGFVEIFYSQQTGRPVISGSDELRESEN